MKIDSELKTIIEETVLEFSRTYNLFQSSGSDYIQELKRDNLECDVVENCISVDGLEPKELIIKQLYKSIKIINNVNKICEIIVNKNSLNCYPQDIKFKIYDMFFILVNRNLELFLSYSSFNLSNEELIEVIGSLLKDIRKKILRKRKFMFPFFMMGLKKDIRLSKSISIIIKTEEHISDLEREHYMFDRHYEYNAMMVIEINEKISYSKGLQFAKTASELTSNLIYIIARNDGKKILPSIPANQSVVHLYEFHLHSEGCDQYNVISKRNFVYDGERCEDFWLSFQEHIASSESRFNYMMKIPELSLINTRKRRVVDLLVTAIQRFGESISETNYESRIVKLVTSLESIVNFGKEEGITDKFKKRVESLTKPYHQSFEDIHGHSRDIYDARSTVAHGSHLSQPLRFDPELFCINVLLSSIVHFHNFGLDKTSFKRELPKYIETIPDAIDDYKKHVEQYNKQ
ncbi:HEPN domain-containing protein [Vibrio antiquarius]|uniref:HEPN domain-containing protein n=1 Tax=Vibrio parahaemolyticus TaxID=670 RepID=A0AA46UR61_VIBPH|nr:HEPN domain-containing protein [Vibrio parahaemolyticus]UYV30388.1 HEPN domain-containing protein [Vibrio parahaemolyticus]UYW19602.1 hypothetical protein IF561_25045 [Vibrio parahaemolyticus]